MQKRGQITMFLILAVAVVFIIGVSYYIYNYGAKKKVIQIKKEKSEPSEIDVVKSYAESCIKLVSENALFNLIGLQGGYIDPNGDASYKEDGVPNKPPASFLENKVPYYLEAICPNTICSYSENIPILSKIGEKLSNYVVVEFEKCFNADIFEDIGLEIVKPIEGVKAYISINAEDVSVNLFYPITVIEDGAKTKLNSFTVALPIRLKALYDSSVELVRKIEDTQSNTYTVTSDDCRSFDRNGLTNLYIKNNEIVQLVDFSTYEKNYFNSYVFQFAVKNININGNCVG